MPETKAHPSLHPDYTSECEMTPARTLTERILAREAARRPLVFPLNAQDNRPIYDAEKKLVSVPECAQFFAVCANFVYELAKAERPQDALEITMRAETIMREHNS